MHYSQWISYFHRTNMYPNAGLFLIGPTHTTRLPQARSMFWQSVCLTPKPIQESELIQWCSLLAMNHSRASVGFLLLCWASCILKPLMLQFSCKADPAIKDFHVFFSTLVFRHCPSAIKLSSEFIIQHHPSSVAINGHAKTYFLKRSVPIRASLLSFSVSPSSPSSTA